MRFGYPEETMVDITLDPRGPFSAACPTRVLLDQIADKWSVLVLIAVSDGPVRFNTLKRQVEGISQKVLTQTLRRLQSNGLIRREAFATVPVTVQYEITPLGRSLSEIVEQLRQWSIKNMQNVSTARSAAG
jgi:DNA-binding HxlR family transcriptional regulator